MRTSPTGRRLSSQYVLLAADSFVAPDDTVLSTRPPDFCVSGNLWAAPLAQFDGIIRNNSSVASAVDPTAVSLMSLELGVVPKGADVNFSLVADEGAIWVDLQNQNSGPDAYAVQLQRQAGGIMNIQGHSSLADLNISNLQPDQFLNLFLRIRNFPDKGYMSIEIPALGYAGRQNAFSGSRTLFGYGSGEGLGAEVHDLKVY